jgi:ABC-type multidrug transport system ATPase subunit
MVIIIWCVQIVRIWTHLLDISKTSQTTIIITTHYIEEARKADRVLFKLN